MAELLNAGQTGRAAADYEVALWRIEKKRKIRTDLITYVVINLFLVGVWAMNGLGSFWPGWVMAGWGVLLALDLWSVYSRRPITQDEIEREMRARP